MKGFVALVLGLGLTLPTLSLGTDYFIYSQYETGQGSYGIDGFVGEDGIDRIVFYSGFTGNGYIYTVELPEGLDPNTHPDNLDAPGAIAPRTFSFERSFPLGVDPDHQSEFWVDEATDTIYLGASKGIRKYVFDTNLNNYVFAGQVAPPSPVDEWYSTQSLGYDKGADIWYAGSISWNNQPGATQRKVWKYDGSQGANGQWVLAFTYTTAGNSGTHHDGLEFLNGHLFLADYEGDKVYEFTPDGELVKEYLRAPLGHELEGMGFGALKHFWCGSHGSTITEFGGGALQQVVQNSPPEVVMGQNIVITSEEQEQTVITGGASDPDGDEVQCRWLMDGVEVRAWAPVSEDGSCPLPLNQLATLSLGEHAFTLEASDGSATGSGKVSVAIANSAPTCVAAGGGAYEIFTPITVSGQVADFDGDEIIYEWLEGETVLYSNTIMSNEGGAPVTLPDLTLSNLGFGKHVLTLKSSDGVNPPATSSIWISIIDTEAPSLSLKGDQLILWPPDHSMRTIKVVASAYDSGGPVVLTASVACNEPIDTLGDGSTIPDWNVVSIDQKTGLIIVELRAERAGVGSDRIYTLIVTAADSSGNQTTAIMDFKVPHNKGKK